MTDKDDPLERAYAAMDAALAATGTMRHALVEDALELWRQARCAHPELPPPNIAPADSQPS
jgi:hypothetical protein